MHPHNPQGVLRCYFAEVVEIIIIIIIIIIFFFFFFLLLLLLLLLLHGLGRLICSGIDAFPSFPGASTISWSSRFVVEGVFRKSGVVHSFQVVDPVLFVFGYTWVGALIVATIYLQLIQNRYMSRSFTVLQCSHQHCVQPVASDV